MAAEAIRGGRQALAQLGWVRGALIFALLLLALFVARYAWQIPILMEAERGLYDVRATTPDAVHVEQDRRIVMVTYTDETLFNSGVRSPLDRAILARALAAMDGMGARSIGIDIFFDSPTPNDAALVSQLRAMRTPTFMASADTITNPNNIQYAQAEFLSEFHARASSATTRPARITLINDNDNVVRAWPGRVRGDVPLLSVAMAEAAGVDARRFADFRGGIRFRRPAQVAEVGEGAEIREVFAKIPIDILIDPEAAPFIAPQLRGAHVLVGGDIVDFDLFDTPLSTIADVSSGEVRPMIGLEVHATMLAQILDGALPSRPGSTLLWLAALLGVIAGAGSALANRRPWLTALLVISQLALILALPFWLQGRGVDTLGFPVAGIAAGWLLGLLAMTLAQRAVGAEQRAFAQSALGRYLPRDIAQQILRDPERLALHGEKRAIYCLFSDLEGFTEMSHAIPPEMVARILNAYLDKLSNVVLAHGGTIDKFVGDAVVAFWGAPIARDDDGLQAAKALVAFTEAGEEFRREMMAAIGPDAPAIGRTRVGLHHGDAVIGNFGGEGRIQYTALGDAMNTAARLEAANKTLGTRALASEEAGAHEVLSGFVPHGRVQLRGRAKPVTIYEPRPDLDSQVRADIAAMVSAHASGYDRVFADLAGKLMGFARNDAALAKLIERLQHTETGGAYVLS
jgi:adenylate cyclase